MKCAKGYEIQILKSNAGFYVGTQDNGEPVCRLSEQYWKTELEANDHLKMHTYRTRQAPEIMWCCGGGK